MGAISAFQRLRVVNRLALPSGTDVMCDLPLPRMPEGAILAP